MPIYGQAARTWGHGLPQNLGSWALLSTIIRGKWVTASTVTAPLALLLPDLLGCCWTLDAAPTGPTAVAASGPVNLPQKEPQSLDPAQGEFETTR